MKSYNKKNTIDSKSSFAGNKHKIAYAFFVVFIFFTYVFYIPSLDSNNLFVKDYSFLNPAVSLIDKDDLLVNFQDLRELLQKKYEVRDDYMISLYFEYLPTGANISLNKDEKMWPASLIKIPVAMSVMKKIQDKKWKLNNELVILDEDKDSEYGILYKEPTGTTFPIKKFLDETLINSDNTAHFVLLRNLDGGELEDVYEHLGLDDIIDAIKHSPKAEAEIDNRITAKRYSIFFRSLYNSTYLNTEYSQMFLSILREAPRELLGKGTPSDIPFVHKTGIRIDEKVKADSGIVYVPGRPYILTVMIQQKKKGDFNQEEIDSIFEEISKEVYNHVANPR